MSGTMLVMEQELCDNCGALLDFFGNCPECGYDGVYWGDDEDEENDPYADSGDYDERAYLMGEYDDGTRS